MELIGEITDEDIGEEVVDMDNPNVRLIKKPDQKVEVTSDGTN